MIKHIIPIVTSATLLLTGCSNNNIDNSSQDENVKLIYSNLADKNTQNEVNKILKENNINEKDADYFIKLVQEYNQMMEKLKTSKDGFIGIDTMQVPYDEDYMFNKWAEKEVEYMDLNCRLTAFKLFKDYIKSEEKFTGDETNLMFDIDAIDNNPLVKFNKNDVEKFINLYAAVAVENSEDVEKHAQAIIKEWDNRKISFIDNPNVSMINVYLHSPIDSNVFVGHAGILIKAKDGYLFIEKYGPTLPYQASKFKDKSQLKEYLMDRLDVDTSNSGVSKPIIMENNELLK